MRSYRKVFGVFVALTLVVTVAISVCTVVLVKSLSNDNSINVDFEALKAIVFDSYVKATIKKGNSTRKFDIVFETYESGKLIEQSVVTTFSQSELESDMNIIATSNHVGDVLECTLLLVGLGTSKTYYNVNIGEEYKGGYYGFGDEIDVNNLNKKEFIISVGLFNKEYKGVTTYRDGTIGNSINENDYVNILKLSEKVDE